MRRLFDGAIVPQHSSSDADGAVFVSVRANGVLAFFDYCMRL